MQKRLEHFVVELVPAAWSRAGRCRPAFYVSRLVCLLSAQHRLQEGVEDPEERAAGVGGPTERASEGGHQSSGDDPTAQREVNRHRCYYLTFLMLNKLVPLSE